MIFLSYILDSNTPSYGNRDKFIISKNNEIVNGIGANTSKWEFTNNHIGTHIDTPYHFYKKLKQLKDYRASDFVLWKIGILEVPRKDGSLISIVDLQLDNLDPEIEILIIKTGYGTYRTSNKYFQDNPGLSAELAHILKKSFSKLRAVGFDFISLTSWNHREEGKKSHLSFLNPEIDIIIIEDMKLDEICSQSILKWIIVSPLRTEEGNGSPVTIIANLNEK